MRASVNTLFVWYRYTCGQVSIRRETTWYWYTLSGAKAGGPAIIQSIVYRAVLLSMSLTALVASAI